MVSAREGNAIANKQLALRDHLWPGMEPYLWNRKSHKGFATIPKTLPLILRIMDEMTKGAPVSSTYMTLWCSTWDNGFVSIIKPDEMAFASGFGGQRGEHTWVGRMKKLQELQFIDIKAGKSGPMTHALIHNPHIILRWHHNQKTPGLVEASFTALVERALEVGAMDLFPAPVTTSPPPPAAETAVAPPPLSGVPGAPDTATPKVAETSDVSPPSGTGGA